MRIIDLTQMLEEGMPVYPGTEPPTLAEANTIERDGFREKLITMYSHTGTHIDAPAHIFPDGATLDSLPLETYDGSACVLDLPAADPRTQENQIAASDFLLLRTHWSRHWGSEEYFGHFPVLDSEPAEWLTGFGLRGVGVDSISVDPTDSADLPAHRILLGAGMVIVENLN